MTATPGTPIIVIPSSWPGSAAYALFRAYSATFSLGWGTVNIEDLLNLVKEEWLWAAVAAISALAAIIGALLSWITAAVIKRRERPEADWASL